MRTPSEKINLSVNKINIASGLQCERVKGERYYRNRTLLALLSPHKEFTLRYDVLSDCFHQIISIVERPFFRVYSAIYGRKTV